MSDGSIGGGTGFFPPDCANEVADINAKADAVATAHHLRTVAGFIPCMFFRVTMTASSRRRSPAPRG